MSKSKSPRERAARALCQSAGNPEDAKFEGRPMWASYLPEVDLVLSAALEPDQWQTMLAMDGESR